MKPKSRKTALLESGLKKTQEPKVFAENCAKYMALFGITQADLVRKTGETKVTISRILRGYHMPGLRVAKIVAQALGVKIDDLLDDRPLANLPSVMRSRR